jgi:hypothetical protein
VLGVDPFSIEDDALSAAELASIRLALRRSFSSWKPEPGSVERFRVAFWARQSGARAYKRDVARMGLIAHEITLRDPLDDWSSLDVGEVRRDREDFMAAIREHLLFRKCVNAGFLTFAPIPIDLEPEFAFSARGTLEQAQRFSKRTDLEFSIAASPEFARAVLGTLPVSDADWQLVVNEGDGGSSEDILRHRLEDLGRFEALALEVREQAGTRLEQAGFAAACDSDFIARDDLDAAFQAAALHDRGDSASRLLTMQAWDVSQHVEFPDLAHVALDDIAAIREHDQAFHEWRLWFGKLCSEAEALASGTNTGLREQFERSLELAQSQIQSSTKSELRKYVQDRQAHADLVALGLGATGSIATGSPLPAIAAGGSSAFSLMRRTVLRRRTRDGWQGILMKLTSSK